MIVGCRDDKVVDRTKFRMALEFKLKLGPDCLDIGVKESKKIESDKT